MRRLEYKKIIRFFYLNTYSFLLLLFGILTLLIPLYHIGIAMAILQILIALIFSYHSAKLFSTWNDKKKKYEILMERNKYEFRPDTFEIFMQAPCGRLLTKAVLKDLNKKAEYKNLKKFKEPFIVSVKKNCVPQKTRIYINEDLK